MPVRFLPVQRTVPPMCAWLHRLHITQNGIAYQPIPKKVDDGTFFLSYRLQTKIVWGIIFCEILMILYRSSLKLISFCAKKIYSRRVLFKKSLRTTLRSEYNTFSRKLTIGSSKSPKFAKRLATITPSQATPIQKYTKNSSFKRIQTKVNI